jgi:pyruvyltransferase
MNIRYNLYRAIKLAKYAICKSNYITINYVVTSKNGANWGTSNWGDDLNNIIPTLISGKKVVPYTLLSDKDKKDLANTLCIGSSIQWLTNKNSVIWGAGLIKEQQIKVSPAKVLAVRGPLTRRVLLDNGINCPEVYGDPVLLLPRYYKPIVEKRYRFGIIPHVSDLNNSIISKLRNRNDITIIDLANYHGKWKSVIDQICQCEYIFSSSLHGLIACEAYRIPAVRIILSNGIIGGDFKYDDFYESIGKKNHYRLDLRDATEFCPENYLKMLESWQPADINVEPLLNACPFK